MPFDRYQCIFVHIPKTAGVSICRSLFENLAGGHTTIAKYQIIFSKKEFDRYFKFTFKIGVKSTFDLYTYYPFVG